MAPTEVKAWYFEQFGDPAETFKFGTVGLPELEAGDILVKVKAVGLNPVDKMNYRGQFYPANVKFPTIPGWDVAGVVSEVGSAVTNFKVGDEVYGGVKSTQFGSLAEYALSTEKKLAKKPTNLSFVEAAAVPVAVLTPLAVFDKFGLKEGDKVLITSGAGGVGVHAIQLAKNVFKASEVTVTASKPKHEFLATLGATKAIDYKNEKFEDVLSDYDFVLDSTAESAKELKVIKPSGKVVTIIEFSAKTPVESFALSISSDLLERVNPYLENGDVKVILDKTSPWKFSEGSKAYDFLESKAVTGKVVIQVEE